MGCDDFKTTLIVGIGNIARKDDGLGIHAIHRLLESEAVIAPCIEVLDGGTTGYNLLSFMMNREHIIIVDALRTDGVPGSIYRFPAHLLHQAEARTAIPRFSLYELLCHVRLAGSNPDVEIIGVVPADIQSIEIGLSEPVENALPRVVAEIMKAAMRRRTPETA